MGSGRPYDIITSTAACVPRPDLMHVFMCLLPCSESVDGRGAKGLQSSVCGVWCVRKVRLRTDLIVAGGRSPRAIRHPASRIPVVVWVRGCGCVSLKMECGGWRKRKRSSFQKRREGVAFKLPILLCRFIYLFAFALFCFI